LCTTPPDFFFPALTLFFLQVRTDARVSPRWFTLSRLLPYYSEDSISFMTTPLKPGPTLAFPFFFLRNRSFLGSTPIKDGFFSFSRHPTGTAVVSYLFFPPQPCLTCLFPPASWTFLPFFIPPQHHTNQSFFWLFLKTPLTALSPIFFPIGQQWDFLLTAPFPRALFFFSLLH